MTYKSGLMKTEDGPCQKGLLQRGGSHGKKTNSRSDKKTLRLMSSVTRFFRARLSEKKKWNSWGEGVFLDPGKVLFLSNQNIAHKKNV